MNCGIWRYLGLESPEEDPISHPIYELLLSHQIFLMFMYLKVDHCQYSLLKCNVYVISKYYGLQLKYLQRLMCGKLGPTSIFRDGYIMRAPCSSVE